MSHGKKLLKLSFIFLACSSLLVTTTAHAQIKGDSIKLAIEPDYNQVSGTHRFLLGENYRKLWAAPVTLPIFHISEEKGGLTIEQLGGGKQTKSLRLKDPTGQEWVLRTIQKYPAKALPPNLRETVARDILQDQVSTEHPFSSLTVPPLAEALGIPHSNPKIVYVPNDPAFGKYQKDFANQVFLFEEREPLDAEKTDNTEKVQKKLQDDNDNGVDQKLLLRARLLDMLLGDWDRHGDQWRWEKIDGKHETVYVPVPRDRDQVYYKTSGVFPWIVAHQWLKAKFQPYSNEIRDIGAWNINADHFDRYFMNSLSEDDWKEQIHYVQSHLTNDVITGAVKLMPDTIYKLSGQEIIGKMKARRDILEEQALDYYRFLSKEVEIPTTDKTEKFTIDNEANGKLTITINKIKKDSTIDKVIYKRTFDPAVTKEVRIYAFDGNDVFSVTGTEPSPIKLRMVGGDGIDTFEVAKNLNDKGNLFIYDRKDQQNVLPSSDLAKIRTSKDTSVNAYNRTEFKWDRFEPIILAHYGNDRGLSIIGGFSYEKHGFRKDPYQFREELLANYSLARKSFRISYKADWIKAIGNNDLGIDVLSRGPNNLSNFFGLGNNTVFKNDHDDAIDYYRNRYDYITADMTLTHTFDKFKIGIGPAFQYYTSSASNNANDFLAAYNQAHTDQNVFSTRFYTGGIIKAKLDTRNKLIIPTQGVYWETTLGGYTGLSNNAHNTYGQIVSEFNFYLNPDRDSILVIADRTGAGTIVGNASYFQQLKLGGQDNFRGFHSNRFTGKSMVYNNLEVRLKVLDFASYLLPGTVGIIGFNDVGRVWTPGESSSEWHDGYGGGIYLIPAQLLLIEAVMGHSNEGSLLYVSLGLRF